MKKQQLPFRYLSLPCKHESSITTLLLLSSQSRPTLWGPQDGRARNAPWAALAGCIMPPNLFGHTMSGHNWGPHKVATLWGKEKQTERLSFRACAEAKDTQFVSTQDRLPWLGLKAVETPSTSCESCQALSTLFPIAGARAANTAEKKTIATILATTKGRNPSFKFT